VRTKVTLVLIFLNVALFFFIFKFERNWRTEKESTERRRRVLGAEAADIRALEVTNTANPAASFSLQRNRDTWFLTKPLDWPANPHAASAAVLALQLLDHETAFAVEDLPKNNLSLADYGLDKPKLTVAFSSSDPAAAGGSRPTTELQIGDSTKDGKRLYVLSPDRQRVHIVNRSLVDSLSIPLEQLRADSLLSIKVFEARSLSVIQTATSDARGGVPGVRVRIRFDGTRWIFESPHTARGSKTAVELVINQLNALRPKSFPSPAPSPSTSPTLRIIIEGNNRQETLFIGEPVTPGVAAGALPSAATRPSAPSAGPVTTEYYAQLEGRSAVFTVEIPLPLMDALRNAQENLREKRFLEFDAAAVTKIELSSPMQPNLPPVTLQRLEPPAGQAANVAPPWQVVQRGEGTQGPQTFPAERSAVQRLLEQLSLLTAKNFKSDAPTSADLEEWGFNRPLREVTLTQSGSTPSMIIRIGTDAARDGHYARVDTPIAQGTSIYQIGSEIMQDLQLSPLAWRDRAVGEPLPPNGRIGEVKLTDLETKQVLFETRLNAAGEAETPPRDPKAFKDLVSALRALRAREFVAGGYADRINAAGSERPWRFQLDATVVIPGAAGIDQPATRTLLLTERLGGNQQFAGSKELNIVFALEQPLIDALWTLAYGNRDPGPRAEPKR
jgi:hypothetical protein